MSESILNIAGVNIVLTDEDATVLYNIIKNKGKVFNEYASNIDETLVEPGYFGNFNLSPAPKGLIKNIAAAKAIGAKYYDFMRKQPK